MTIIDELTIQWRRAVKELQRPLTEREVFCLSFAITHAKKSFTLEEAIAYAEKLKV